MGSQLFKYGFIVFLCLVSVHIILSKADSQSGRIYYRYQLGTTDGHLRGSFRRTIESYKLVNGVASSDRTIFAIGGSFLPWPADYSGNWSHWGVLDEPEAVFAVEAGSLISLGGLPDHRNEVLATNKSKDATFIYKYYVNESLIKAFLMTADHDTLVFDSNLDVDHRAEFGIPIE